MKQRRSKIKLLLTAALTAGLLLITVTGGHAVHAGKKNVTPYGDYCNRVSHYGMHQSMLNNSQVKKSLEHYYRGKGFDITIISLKGRFVKAHVLDGNSVVDTIIFDRETGRVRSIN